MITAGPHLSFGGGASGGTSGAIDTSGMNLIVVYMSMDSGGTPASLLTDSYSNTWTNFVAHGATNPANSLMLYCLNPTVGAGHTFSYSNLNAAPSWYVATFSGVRTSGAVHADTGAGNGAGSTTVQPGSITPSIDELLVCGVGYAITGGGSATISAGFTIVESLPFVASNHYGGNIAYLIASSASPVNPTWTASAATIAGMSSSMAGFLAPVASGVAASNFVVT